MGEGALALRTALVIGGASCLEDDLANALKLQPYDGVVACNDAGAWWPGELTAWVSLHADKLAKTWIKQRRLNGHQPAKLVVAKDPGHSRITNLDGYTHPHFPGQIHSGSSGLMAVKVALIDLKFDKAVCCGIPMDSKLPHFFDAIAWRAATSHMRGWQEALPALRGRVTSMSGWTKELLNEH